MVSVQRAQSQTLTPRLHSTTFQIVKWAIILNLRGCAHIIDIPVCRTFTGHSENAGKHYRPCARRLQTTPEQYVWARCLLTYKSQHTRAHMQFYCVCCAAKNTQTCLAIYIVSTASALRRLADREDITHIRWATAWERWFLGVCAWCARILTLVKARDKLATMLSEYRINPNLNIPSMMPAGARIASRSDFSFIVYW